MAQAAREWAKMFEDLKTCIYRNYIQYLWEEVDSNACFPQLIRDSKKSQTLKTQKKKKKKKPYSLYH